MKIDSVLLVAITSIALSSLAQLSMKIGMNSESVQERLGGHGWTIRAIATTVMEPRVLFGFFLYGVGALLWLAVLAKWDLSKAYPFVGLGFVFAALLGRYVLSEPLSLSRASSIAIIALGIALLAKS